MESEMLTKYIYKNYFDSNIRIDIINNITSNVGNDTRCLQFLSMGLTLVGFSLTLTNIMMQQKNEVNLGLSLEELGEIKKIRRRDNCLILVFLFLVVLTIVDGFFKDFGISNDITWYVRTVNFMCIILFIIILILVISLFYNFISWRKEKIIREIVNKMLENNAHLLKDENLSFFDKYEEKYKNLFKASERYIANQDSMTETLIQAYNIIVKRILISKRTIDKKDIFTIAYVITMNFCDYEGLRVSTRINNINFMNNYFINIEREYIKALSEKSEEKIQKLELLFLGLTTAYFNSVNGESLSEKEGYFDKCFRIINDNSEVAIFHKTIVSYLIILGEYYLRLGLEKRNLYYYFTKYLFYWKTTEIFEKIKELVISNKKLHQEVSDLIFQNWCEIYQGSDELRKSILYLTSDEGANSYMQKCFI